MLNNEQLNVILERWIAGRTGNKVLCPERNTCVVGRRTCTECAIDAITPLLDTVEDLRELLQAVYEYAESPFGNFEIHKKVEEALK